MTMFDKDVSESLYLCLQLPMEQVKIIPVLVQLCLHLLILVSCSHITILINPRRMRERGLQ